MRRCLALLRQLLGQLVWLLCCGRRRPSKARLSWGSCCLSATDSGVSCAAEAAAPSALAGADAAGVSRNSFGAKNDQLVSALG